MAAISKAWVAIADTAVDPDSPLDATLMTGIRDDLVHLREWLGNGFIAGAVQDHNHDGLNSALIEVGPNLIRNGSFENNGAGWTITDYTGGSHAFSTSTRYHGAKSLSFTSTSTANGGGDALTGEFLAVAGSEWYNWAAQVSASVANVSGRITVVWYDAAQSQISEVQVYNSVSVPTGKTRLGRGVQAPATARFAKIRVMGGVPGAGSATGTVFFDGVSFTLGGDMVLLDDQEVGSAVASIDFTTGISAQFDAYLLTLHGVTPATAATTAFLRVSTDGGSSWVAGTSYDRAIVAINSAGTVDDIGSTGLSAMHLTRPDVASTATRGVDANVWIFNPADADLPTRVISDAVYWQNGGALKNARGANRRASAAVDNAVQLLFDSGNIASGRARLYGLRKGVMA